MPVTKFFEREWRGEINAVEKKRMPERKGDITFAVTLRKEDPPTTGNVGTNRHEKIWGDSDRRRSH